MQYGRLSLEGRPVAPATIAPRAAEADGCVWRGGGKGVACFADEAAGAGGGGGAPGSAFAAAASPLLAASGAS
eukprot:1502408-Prymnesium_polylepis.1